MSHSTTLLVVDLQTAAFDGVMLPRIHQADLLLRNVRSLIDTARTENVPVVHIQHCGAADEPFAEDAPGFPIFEAVAPIAGELVVRKRSASAFEGTDLHEHLLKIGAETLVIAGLQSEHCVAATCRGALKLGYRVHLAEDAHGTWPDDRRSAEEIIQTENTALESEGVSVAGTETLLGRLRSRPVEI